MTREERQLVKALDAFAKAAEELAKATANPSPKTWSVMTARFEAPIFSTDEPRAEVFVDRGAIDNIANLLGETPRDWTDRYNDTERSICHKGVKIFAYM